MTHLWNTDVSSGRVKLRIGRHEVDRSSIADRLNHQLRDGQHIEALTFTELKTSPSLICLINSYSIHTAYTMTATNHGGRSNENVKLTPYF